jgi:hypothetical protein
MNSDALMDRLRAANPVDELPDAPPVEPLLARLEPTPSRRPRRRYALVPAAGLLAALIAVVAGLELRGSSVDVVAEAREALGGSSGIVHIVVRDQHFNPDGTQVQASSLHDRRGRRIGTVTDRKEIWWTQNPTRIHTRETARLRDGGLAPIDSDYADGVVRQLRFDGKLQSERVPPEAQRAIEDTDASSGLTLPGRDPLPVIRRLLADGELKPAGTTKVGDRTVQRLVGSQPSPDAMTPGVKVEYLVDAKTYAPVQVTTRATLRDGRPAGGSKLTFITYERLPLTPKNEATLRIR